MVYQDALEIKTVHQGEMTDITGRVGEIVAASGCTVGMVHVFNQGSTGVIGTIEFEPGLQADLPRLLNRLIPPSESYGHEQAWHDGNGHSHLQASMLGPEVTIPLAGRALRLGTWQQVFHLECDIKPRRRTIVVTVMGE